MSPSFKFQCPAVVEIWISFETAQKFDQAEFSTSSVLSEREGKSWPSTSTGIVYPVRSERRMTPGGQLPRVRIELPTVDKWKAMEVSDQTEGLNRIFPRQLGRQVRLFRHEIQSCLPRLKN